MCVVQTFNVGFSLDMTIKKVARAWNTGRGLNIE